jgi:hypothetical protein
MKIALLIIGILITLASGAAFIFSLMLPTLTSNKINFRESFIFIVVSLLGFFAGLIVTVASGIWILVSKKRAAKLAQPAG